MSEWLRAITLKMTANGVAAALCVVALCVAILGLFGQGPIAESALKILAIIAGGLSVAIVFVDRRQ